MKRLSRVMCAVAIDDREKHVFAHALARRNGAKLLVVHAVSPEVAFNRGATDRVDFLRNLRSIAEGAGVDVRVTVQQGPVGEILRAARNMKTPLIVIGAARRTRVGSRLFGKTGQLIRDARVPILAVPIPTAAREATDTFWGKAA